MQAQVKLLAIHGFQCCFTAAPVLTLYTSICVAGYKNLDAVSSFAAGDLGCLCCMLSSRKKWPLASSNGCTGGTESNSPQAGAVLGTWRGEYNLDPVFCTPPSPQSLKNMHQPDKALIPREAKEESQGRWRKVRGSALHSGGQGWRWHNRCQKNAINRLKMEGVFFFLPLCQGLFLLLEPRQYPYSYWMQRQGFEKRSWKQFWNWGCLVHLHPLHLSSLQLYLEKTQTKYSICLRCHVPASVFTITSKIRACCQMHCTVFWCSCLYLFIEKSWRSVPKSKQYTLKVNPLANKKIVSMHL